jgi:ribosome-associated protein
MMMPQDEGTGPGAPAERAAEASAGGSVEETIRLDQFLKLAQAAATGGQAKWMIQNGEVRVNGVVETRRGRKLHPGDTVEVRGDVLVVETE